MAEESSCSANQSHEVDESNCVTMLDVLADEKALEDDANAVLGDSDDKNCTYPQGYIKRQALYACLTCTPADSGRPAGICLACSYHCHEDHELVELYTKRNFRCDCGTEPFNGKKCSLLPDKPLERNDKNSYNQNFIGLYCSCKRPYPDPEDDTDDVMIQCIVCEDWYHFRHLNAEIKSSTDYSEMVCGACVKLNKFLLRYPKLHVNKEVMVDVTTISPIKNSSSSEPIPEGNPENLPPNDAAVTKETVVGSSEIDDQDQKKQNGSASVAETSPLVSSHKNDTSDTSVPVADSVNSDAVSKKCSLSETPDVAAPDNVAAFFNADWRKHLCKCDDCIAMYKRNGVDFLVDEGDTVSAYEERGKNKEREGQYEQGLRALSSLDRVQQVEALTEYNELKSHLSDYLRKFAESKKVVREEDIKEFFSGLNETRKKRKIEPPAFYCR